MNDAARDIPWVNTNEYTENFEEIPYEEQLKYAGQYIAASLDGTTILVGGTDEREVESKLRTMGLNPSWPLSGLDVGSGGVGGWVHDP